jgi:hypothetical protein
MTTSADASTKPYILHFRCPPKLLAAMQRASKLQLVSLSDVARSAIVTKLRQDGLLTDEPTR